MTELTCNGKLFLANFNLKLTLKIVVIMFPSIHWTQVTVRNT